MNCGKPFYKQEREYETNLHKIRVSRGLTVVALCSKVGSGCYPGMIASLQSGMITPDYQVGVRKGEIKPWVKKLLAVLRCSAGEAFPRSICSIDGKDGYNTDDQVNSATISEFTMGLDPFTALQYKQENNQINELLGRLTLKEEAVFRSRIISNQTLEAVAQEFGCSRENIRQYESRALRKIKYLLKKEKKP